MYDVYEFCVIDGCTCSHKSGVLIAGEVDKHEASRLASDPSPGYVAEIHVMDEAATAR